MKIIVMVVAACVGALQGALAALMAWHLLLGVRPQDDSSHTLAVMIGGLAGAILGGAFARQGRVQGAYLVTIFIRCALVSSGLASCRLGLSHGHVLTSVVFLLWGTFLCLVGGLVVLAPLFDSAPIEQREEPTDQTGPILLGFATYGSLALTILLVGCYRSGERLLTFRRADGSPRADFLLETRRWFGLASVGRSRLTGVRDWRSAFREGEGVVLVSDEGEMFIDGDIASYHSLAGMIDRSLRDFLGSSRPSLSLAERASYPFWVYVLSAILLIGVGLLFDPLVPSRLKGLAHITFDE